MAEQSPQEHYRSRLAGASAAVGAEGEWSGDAEGYDAWFESPWGRYAWGVESRLVRAGLEGARGDRVLDVGCGTGRSSALLGGPGRHVVGIDPDPGVLSLALSVGSTPRSSPPASGCRSATMSSTRRWP